MGLADIKNPDSIIKAVKEFDRLGREAFLKKYGRGRAREYFLVVEGKEYDSKAIVDAAHQIELGSQIGRFSGGEKTVKKTLERMGFEVKRKSLLTRVTSIDDLSVGARIDNDTLCKLFGCAPQGGMRRSHATNTLVIVTDHLKALYQDRWEGDILHYTGMGLEGDQSLSFGQNKTLAESNTNDISVHLFEVQRKREYTYVGEVSLVGEPYQERQRDKNQKLRSVWVFPLKLPDTTPPSISEDTFRENEAKREKAVKKLSQSELEERARSASKIPGLRTVASKKFQRDTAVTEHAKRRAQGICQLCEKEGPFEDKHGEPFLETHHIVWLSRGGEDSIDNTVALCPNCHRKMHILDRKEDKRRLKQQIINRG